MGFRRKWTTVTLCKSARSAIQLFYIHYRKYFAIILNSAVYLSSAKVSMFHTLVPLLDDIAKGSNSTDVGTIRFRLFSNVVFSWPVRSTRRAIVVSPVVCVCVRVRVRVPVTLRQSFKRQGFQKFISRQPLIRKHSYLDQRYPRGPAFIPWVLTPETMPPGVGLAVKF